MELTDKEMLNYAIENGMIDLVTVQEKIQMNERKKYLSNHKYKKWHDEKNGRYCTYLPDGNSKYGRKLVKRSTEKALDDAIVQFYKEHENIIKMGDLFKLWVDQKLQYGEIKKQSYDKYTDDYNRFFKESRIAEIEFQHITENMLEEHIKTTIKEQNLTAKTYGGMRIVINGVFKYAKKHGYTKISISQFLGDLALSSKSFKKVHKRREEKVFLHDEEWKVKNFIDSDKPSLLNYGVLLGFETGMRCGEISSLTWDDVDGDVLRVHRTEIKYRDDDGKYTHAVQEMPKSDAGFREIVLTKKSKEILEHVKELNPNGKYIFTKNGKRMLGKTFTSRLYRVCRINGIDEKSMHKARSTYATKLIDGKVPDSLVQDQMGHSDIQTTYANYYFNSNTDIEKKRVLKHALHD